MKAETLVRYLRSRRDRPAAFFISRDDFKEMQAELMGMQRRKLDEYVAEIGLEMPTPNSMIVLGVPIRFLDILPRA